MIRRKSRAALEQIDINVTPMLDLLLVLLVIFMVFATSTHHDVSVNLPKVPKGMQQETPKAPQAEDWVISINKEGEAFLNDKPTTVETLAQRLKEDPRLQEQRIYVRGDQDAHYGAILNIFCMLVQAGFPRVTLMTQV